MAFPVKFAGNEYDLKKFMRDHPGGVNTLNKYKGKSIAQAMKLYGHSYSAYHMLSDFKVENNDNLTGSVSENGRIITKEEAEWDSEEIAFLEELEAVIITFCYNDPQVLFAIFVLLSLCAFYLRSGMEDKMLKPYFRGTTQSRLDWSKPILSQIHKIAPHYDKWVNTAVYRKCRLFESSILESFTFTPWYIVPMFWIPIIIYLGVSQFMTYVLCGDQCPADGLTSFQFVRHIVFGVIIWSLLEYSVHRWVFHFDPGSSLTLIQIHFLIHGLHHKVPFDGLRQVFPPIPALVLGSLMFIPAWCIFSYPIIKTTGGIIGYLTYDMIHFYVHHGSPKDGTYLYAMKRYHSNHHFLNHNKAFGISSQLWDHVFKTFVHVKKLGFGLQW